MNTQTASREAVPEMPNPLNMHGLAFVEYATTRPQAFGQVLESMGFLPVARHRSREVTLYRQGGMNLVVNAHPDDARVAATAKGHPVLSAVAFRVRDALQAHSRCLALGAWDAPSHARAMELHIPAIQGPGGSRFYFVDRWDSFSIFDIDFEAIRGVQGQPPSLCDMRYFGVVQYIGAGRSAAWMRYFEQLFDFVAVPDDQRFGILPKGTLLKSPCRNFLWQLVEPDPGLDAEQHNQEQLQRLGLGVPDVAAAVQALKARGVGFVDAGTLHPEDRGALTLPAMGVSFELVHQDTQA